MRKPREKEDQAVFHVACRCNNKEQFFKMDKQKSIVRNNIRRMRLKFAVVIHTFCIMNNHLHITLQLGKGEDISRVMHWFNFITANDINTSLNRSGHMWGGRFWSKIIRTLKEFFHVFQYINLNPVKAGLAEEPGDWEYGGLCHYKKYRGDDILRGNPDWILNLFREPWAWS